ncbi:hypothetical protein GCM10027286_09300 [Virgibacillus ainsalahensis]
MKHKSHEPFLSIIRTLLPAKYSVEAIVIALGSKGMEESKTMIKLRRLLHQLLH